jgi:predicted membrane metal-binding protein
MKSYIFILRACACLALLAFSIDTCQIALAQVESTDIVAVNKTDARAYRTLFRQVNGIKALYDQGRAVDKDLSFLKSGLAWRLGMSAEEYGSLEVVAGDCEADLAPIHAQIQQTITEFHKQYSLVGRNAANPSSQLAALQEDENAVVLSCRDRLQSAIDQRRFPHIQGLVRQTFGKQLMTTDAAKTEGR